MALLPPLLLVLAAMLVAVVHVPQHDRISPVDEYSYIDYVDKVPDQGVVRQGEEIGPFARNYYLCHGIELFRGTPEYELFAPRKDLCGDREALSTFDGFPQGGRVSADIYTPIYFAVTWVLARPLDWVGIDDRVQAWRLTGAVWLALAAVLLYFGAMRWGARRSAAWAIAMTMVASPVALWSNTYVSTDATGLFAGSLMLFLAAGAIRGRPRPALLALASVFVTLLKLQNFFAVAAVALCLIIVALARHRQDSSRRWRSVVRSPVVVGALAAVGASMVGQAMWLAIRSRLSTAPSPDLGVSVPYTLRRTLIDMTNFLPGSLDTSASGQEGDVAQYLFVSVLKLLVVGGVVGAVFLLPRLDPAAAMAASAIGIAVVGPPVLATAAMVMSGEYVPPVFRYGIPLIPIYLMLSARMISQRPRFCRAMTVVVPVVFVGTLVAYV